MPWRSVVCHTANPSPPAVRRPCGRNNNNRDGHQGRPAPLELAPCSTERGAPQPPPPAPPANAAETICGRRSISVTVACSTRTWGSQGWAVGGRGVSWGLVGVPYSVDRRLLSSRRIAPAESWVRRPASRGPRSPSPSSPLSQKTMSSAHRTPRLGAGRAREMRPPRQTRQCEAPHLACEMRRRDAVRCDLRASRTTAGRKRPTAAGLLADAMDA
jgi:hypothetical protein